MKSEKKKKRETVHPHLHASIYKLTSAMIFSKLSPYVIVHTWLENQKLTCHYTNPCCWYNDDCHHSHILDRFYYVVLKKNRCYCWSGVFPIAMNSVKSRISNTFIPPQILNLLYVTVM